MQKTVKIKEYKFYPDAGHGWLAVKLQELIDLEIIGKISSYSYFRGKTVYLEEDCDLDTFLQTLKEKNIPYKIKSPDKYTNRSPIRSYERFSIDLLEELPFKNCI